MVFDAVTFGLLLASAVRLSAPILLASLGELVSERAGVLNIGLEGLMLFGAFGAVLGLQWISEPLLGVAAGMAAGVLASIALGLAVVVLRADSVVAGIGFNILALGGTSLGRELLLSPSFTAPSLRSIASWRIPGLWELPVVGRAFFGQSPLLYGGIVLAVIIYGVIRYSRLGLVLRAVGEGAGAADAAGVPVTAVRFAAMIFCGLLAGVAGAYLALIASGGVFTDNITAGRGYLAVAVVIFGRWNPLWVTLASVLFGCADALQYQGQAIGLGLPAPLLLMFPFLLALVAWTIMGRSNATPGDLGIPFIRGAR